MSKTIGFSEKVVKMGLTFDDVLIIPARSEVHPQKVNVETLLTRKIPIHIPLSSAAMDTVTEAELAIALAREGGIGFIHKNLSIGAQRSQVEKVKRSEAGTITDPITLHPDQLVEDAIRLMEINDISGLPVVNGEGKLVGILTNRDLRFIQRRDVKVSEVMTKDNLITAPVGVGDEEAKRLLHRHRIEKLLVVDEKNHLQGLITVKDIQKKEDYPQACKDDEGRLRVGAAVGVGRDTMKRVKALVEAHVDVIVVDTAHAHSEGALRTLDKIRNKYPDLQLVGGNIGRPEAAEELINLGVDAIKIGMGPGAICTTRIVAGVGVPQLTAIMDCAEVAHSHGVPLIADGGIKYSGDIVKALVAGADSVMIGSLFAGTQEAPGEVVHHHGKTFKVFRGMGSIGAMKEGSADRYSQEGVNDSKFVAEGIEGEVSFKGKLASNVFQLVGGIRQGMGYAGCATIAELKEKARFMQITQAGVRESHPHDVVVTKEAPNYRTEGR